jgi:N-acyl-D-amino-acid deacylase
VAQAGAKAGAKGPAVTGSADPGLASFDRLMTSFVQEHQVPGAALAVTKDGRLVYARGFGYADVDRKEPVQPTALFRIASISKPLTAVAALQLAERGKLRLDDKVFDLLKLKPILEPGARLDPRLREVTVLQLLRHTGGWDRQKSFDPMFRPLIIARAAGVPPPAGPEAIIRYMMGKPLDFDPGSDYAYSNFGYCLLGRVIEVVSKQPYEEYVRKEVLAPLGIRRMRLGHTLPARRAPDEVHYYDEKQRTARAVVGDIGRQVPLPYGAWYLEAMDSHGGWIASAVDLVRFASAFDDPQRCPILRPASIRIMFGRPEGRAGYAADGKPKAPYYGCGWMVRPVGDKGASNDWHTGSLDGTSTLLVRRHDGLDWAVLFNNRNGPKGEVLSGAIDRLVHEAADAVKTWPRTDLFPKYGFRRTAAR